MQRKCFESFFVLLCWQKRWHYLKITEGWHFRYMLQMGQITQIQQVTLYQWWIVVNNILNWFCFVLSCKMDGVMITLSFIILKNDQTFFKNLVVWTLQDFWSMFGHFSTLWKKWLWLLIVFFLGMFCKLENMRWPSNNLKYLTEVLDQNG